MNQQWIDFKKLREQLDFRELLRHYNVTLKPKKADQLVGLCRACHGRGTRREAASYDLCSFKILKVQGECLLSDPAWRPMKEPNWRELNLEPRR